MHDLDRDHVGLELAQAPRTYHALLDAATPKLLGKRTAGTRWTNREMLFHLLFGYLIVRRLLPLVRLVSALPRPVGRAFAAALNAGARPFHVVNYLGSVGGGRLLSPDRMGRWFDSSCAKLARRLGRETDAELARRMPFPTKWDPFFADQMSLLEVYHYPQQHFDFHRAQLTVDPPN
jgi:DinB superfamily